MDKINEIVSIIIPIYNGEAYIDTCLGSLVNQSYSYLEILLINDGSNDLTEIKCKEWVRKDKRIKYFFQENKGVSEARNLGIINSSGSYITFVDVDDTCKIELISKLVKTMQRDKECDVVFCGYEVCNMEEGIIRSQFGDELVNESIKEAGMQLSDKKYDCGVWGKLFRRNVIVNNEHAVLFENKFQIGEDYAWLICALKHCTYISSIQECLYNYNIRDGSSSHSFALDKRNMSHLKALEHCLNIEWVDDVGCKEDIEYRLFTQIRIFKLVSLLKNNQYYIKYIDEILTKYKNLKSKWYHNSRVPVISKVKQYMMDIVFNSPLDNYVALYIYNWGRKKKLIVQYNSR